MQHTCQIHVIVVILLAEDRGRILQLAITEEYKETIEKMVASNKRFSGNEDLFEDFCSEALEKSLFLLQRTTEIEKISSYLNRIVTTSIINVLKSSGRITRSSEGYKNISNYTVSIENPLDDGLLEIKDPTINFVEEITQQETLDEIYNCILKIDQEEPEEMFGKIFHMKYTEGKKQREIADTLGISQGEVSKRLFTLMQKINNEIQ